MTLTPSTTPRKPDPSILSHLIALLMPFTMVVLVPSWLVREYGRGEYIALQLSGTTLFLGGLTLFVATLLLFISVGKGTLAPWNPTKKLIVAGPYRYCRNPMISGVLFMILGQALFFASPALLVWALVFFMVNTTYFLATEEPSLARKFGSSYTTYKHRVPRWIPRLRPYRAES